MLAKRLVDLIVSLEEKHISPDALSPGLRRRIILVYLRERSEVTNRQIAEIVGLSEAQVIRIKNQLREVEAWEVDDVNPRKILAEAKMKSRELFTKLCRARDFTGAWNVYKGYVQMLMDLGYLKRQPIGVAVGHFDLEKLGEEFIRERGIRGPDEFFKLIEESIHGNGKGNGRHSVSVPVLPAAGSPADGGEGGGGENPDSGPKD